MAEETNSPSPSGWRKKQLRALEKRRQKDRMADIRAARRENILREEAIARGEDPDSVSNTNVDPVPSRKPREHESSTISPDYPDPENMGREEMFAYLKSHGVTPGPATKDETLRRKVTEVRDGGQETPPA